MTNSKFERAKKVELVIHFLSLKKLMLEQRKSNHFVATSTQLKLLNIKEIPNFIKALNDLTAKLLDQYLERLRTSSDDYPEEIFDWILKKEFKQMFASDIPDIITDQPENVEDLLQYYVLHPLLSNEKITLFVLEKAIEQIDAKKANNQLDNKLTLYQWKAILRFIPSLGLNYAQTADSTEEFKRNVQNFFENHEIQAELIPGILQICIDFFAIFLKLLNLEQSTIHTNFIQLF